MIFVKQFGAKRTGTNYLFTLLHNNFTNVIVLVNQLGWKHGGKKDFKTKYTKKENKLTSYVNSANYKLLGQAIDNDDVVITINIKNPYAWIESLKRYERTNYTVDDVKTRVIHYNKLYKHWKEAVLDVYKKSCLIRYEDMLSDYRVGLRLIEKRSGGLKRKTKRLHNVGRAVGPRTVNKDFKNYYLNNKIYLSKLDSGIKKIITNNIDWQLMKEFNYTPE